MATPGYHAPARPVKTGDGGQRASWGARRSTVAIVPDHDADSRTRARHEGRTRAASGEGDIDRRRVLLRAPGVLPVAMRER
jgi:hypothetical protein